VLCTGIENGNARYLFNAHLEQRQTAGMSRQLDRTTASHNTYAPRVSDADLLLRYIDVHALVCEATDAQQTVVNRHREAIKKRQLQVLLQQRSALQAVDVDEGFVTTAVGAIHGDNRFLRAGYPQGVHQLT
jgi:hypothetical protein